MPEISQTSQTTGISLSPARRSVVAAASGVGLAAVLTACGSSDDKSDRTGAYGSVSSGAASTDTDGDSDGGTTGTGSPSTSAAPDGGATGTGSPSTSAAPGGGTALGRTSDIPVGGGKVFADQKVVVTQPTAGQFKGFSAICTHQRCLVGSVSGGTINCPCHGSKYRVADGSVASGPASTPLAPEQVTVSGNEISLA